MKDRVVAVIPARAGSKGIPNKNLASLAGLPLLSWSIRQVVAGGIPEVVVSTDSATIGKLAIEEGATWLRRPSLLATDTATSESALEHAVIEMGLGPRDIVVFAQVTSPLRLPSHVGQCLETLVSGGADSVFSGVRIDDVCLWEGLQRPVPVNYDPSNRTRRQDSAAKLVENGSLYAFRAGGLLTFRSRVHGEVAVSLTPKWTLHEIDEPEDLCICEALMRSFVIPEM